MKGCAVPREPRRFNKAFNAHLRDGPARNFSMERGLRDADSDNAVIGEQRSSYSVHLLQRGGTAPVLITERSNAAARIILRKGVSVGGGVE